MQIIGQKILRLSETDSTNLYAERLLEREVVEEGTVITTAFQAAGRGQGDNKWVSDRGQNLLASVILMPTFLPASDQFLLNKAVTLAVCDLLITLGIEPSVKWPNDIHAEGKKIAGLLISHRVNGSQLDYTIVGIGLNLNQAGFPPGLSPVVSATMLTGKNYNVDDVLAEMNSLLDQRYTSLREGDRAQLETDYLVRLAGLGKWLQYSAGGNEFEGRITGVDEFGRLKVELRNGIIEIFAHGEIKMTSGF
jgi:BirA family transcriptional regulator, biotin operon repressor / biotin---[acetyl-CoA-carboxylase] ligase